MNAIIKDTESGRYRHLDPDDIDWSACERRWVGGKTRLRWATKDEVPVEHLILELHTNSNAWKGVPPMVAVIDSRGKALQYLHWNMATKKFLVTRDMMPELNSTDTVEVDIYPYRPQVFEVKEPAFFEEDEGIDDVYFEPGSTIENHYGEYRHVLPQKAANGRYISEAQAYGCIDRYNQMNGLIAYSGSLKNGGTEYAYIADPMRDVKFEDIEPMEKHVCSGRKVHARWSEDGRVALLDAEGNVKNILSARIVEHRCDLGPLPRDRMSRRTVEIEEKPFIAYAVKVVQPTAVTIHSQKYYLQPGDHIEWKKYKTGHIEVAAVSAEEAAERFASYENPPRGEPKQAAAGRGL